MANRLIEARTDHLGNLYESVDAMTEHYGLSKQLYQGRMKAGWTKQRALTTPKKESTQLTQVIDPRGQIFKNEREMCKAWKKDYISYKLRRENGMSMEESLTYVFTQCEDHLGNKYNTIIEMCKAYNVKPRTYTARREAGKSVEEALTYVASQHEDHLGNKYNTIGEMCEAYGISQRTYSSRIKSGKSVEEALTKKVRKKKV